MNTLTCVIVDDEPLARRGIAGYVSRIDWLRCTALLDSIRALKEFLTTTGIEPDILFLDIEMPGMSGLDFIAEGKAGRAVVIITAYGKHALRGYDLNVTDYLLKPVSFSRFEKAAEKARAFLDTVTNDKSPGAIFVKSDKVLYRVEFDDIIFIEAMENYIILHTPRGKIVSRMTLKELLERLPATRFMRVHKSYAVDITKILRIDSNNICFRDNMNVPVSRNYKNALLKRLFRQS